MLQGVAGGLVFQPQRVDVVRKRGDDVVHDDAGDLAAIVAVCLSLLTCHRTPSRQPVSGRTPNALTVDFSEVCALPQYPFETDIQGFDTR